MENNKRKRWRPSISMMRELEERVGTLEDEKAMLENEVISLKGENDILGKSNSYMETELIALRSEVVRQLDEITDLQRELEFLRNRGLWDRIINR